MTQTLGSQFFGPWYDIVGFVLAAGMFFYLSIGTLPLQFKERLPAFLQNKKLCAFVAMCFTAAAIYHVAIM